MYTVSRFVMAEVPDPTFANPVNQRNRNNKNYRFSGLTRLTGQHQRKSQHKSQTATSGLRKNQCVPTSAYFQKLERKSQWKLAEKKVRAKFSGSQWKYLQRLAENSGSVSRGAYKTLQNVGNLAISGVAKVKICSLEAGELI